MFTVKRGIFGGSGGEERLGSRGNVGKGRGRDTGFKIERLVARDGGNGEFEGIVKADT